MQDLVGTWKLVDYVVTDVRGTSRRPLGDRPLGLLLYAPDGWMSVQMTARGRTATGDPGRRQTSTIAYSGRWVRRGDKVLHRPVVSTVPAWVGTVLERTVELDGRRLVLETPARRSGDRIIRSRLTWRRVELDAPQE